MKLNVWTCVAAAAVLPVVAFCGAARERMLLSGAGWTVDGEAVSVPHAWDAATASDPTAPCTRRMGTYARKLPPMDASRRWFVRFEGVSTKAVVSVNGREVGRHAGAFTPFTFEITGALKPGAENLLEVVADNRFDPSVAPIAGDFTLSGGIYRDAWLLSAPKDAAFRDGFFDDERAMRVKPRAELRADGFYVDGKKTFMKGVNYHQDGPNGWVLAPDQEEKDLRLIMEMGANAIRTAHYPRSSKFYDLCDKLGLFVWTEIPFVNCMTNDAATCANLFGTAREMVLAHKRHPCIACWGLFNELYEDFMPAGTAEPMVGALNALVHDLDPDRPTTAASHRAEKKELNGFTDALGINIYPGWYWGKAKDLGYHWEVQASNNARATCAVSEFGAGGCIDQHRNPAGERPQFNGRFHPEEYQAKFHHDAYASLQGNPRLWGVFVWQMFDTRSPTRKEGSTDGVNDKGLVTRDRRTKKDAYYFYKANWNPEPMLHLAGARMTSTTNAVHDVVAFCNVPGKVTLRVNGRVVGERSPDAVKQALWPAVPLAPGENAIELSAGALKARATVYRVVPAAVKPSAMTFGVCAPLDAAPALKAEGWDFIEGTVGSVVHPELSDEQWRPFAEKAKACPLPIRSMNGFLPGTERLTGPNVTHEHALAWAVTACRRADELGIPYVVFGSGTARRVPEGFPMDEARKQFVAFCRALAKRIENLKVTIVLEPLNVRETNFFNGEAEGVGLVEEIGSPKIRLLADLYHMMMDAERADSLYLSAARLLHVHVAENKTRLEPKTEADFLPYFKALREIGYAGGVSCECGYSKEPDARKNALKRLRAWAER